jgi:hypothetical protein
LQALVATHGLVPSFAGSPKRVGLLCRRRHATPEERACARLAEAHKATFEAPGKAADAVPSGSLYLPDVRHVAKIRDAYNATMLNSVRFGTIAGRERAVVAGQNRVVYFFELPSSHKPEEHVPVCCGYTVAQPFVAHLLAGTL